MVEYGRNDCLTHKLCQTLLNRKWIKYGLFFQLVQMVLFLLFLACITTIVVTYPVCNDADSFASSSRISVTPEKGDSGQMCYNYGGFRSVVIAFYSQCSTGFSLEFSCFIFLLIRISSKAMGQS